MAEMLGAAEYAQKQQWAQNNRQRAKELILDATVLQNELFDLGDLSPFLRMLARMPYQNPRNLLLLSARNPEASALTGFRIWQRRIPDPMAPVLRSGQKGKGIELLVPFTDTAKNSITWYAALHFDVSQVNVSYKPHVVYEPDSPSHISSLISALITVLREHHNLSIMPATDSDDINTLKAADIEGRLLNGMLLLRQDLSEEQKLNFLATTTCRLYLQYKKVPQNLENYASLCAAYALSLLWNIPNLSDLPTNPTLLSSVPKEERYPVLDLLQRCVYTIDSQVSIPYRSTLDLDAEVSAELGI